MHIIHVKEPNRKTYSLQFDHMGRLVVKTDTKFFGNKLDEILLKHNRWIKNNFKRIREQITFAKQDYLKEGYSYNILGETYSITYRTEKTEYFSIKIENQNIVITQSNNQKLSKSEVKKELIKFFRLIARDYLDKRTASIATKMNLKYRKIFIKSQKSKWGSCSSAKNLNFNWKLIFAPKSVIDYVIVHELSHLRHMNHSKSFWNLVEKFCPNYKIHWKWLKDNEGIVRILS